MSVWFDQAVTSAVRKPDRSPDEECAITAMIQEPVPGEVKELLENQQLNGVPVLLSTTSDLSLKGDLRGHWIVVTRDHLAVVADGALPRLVNHLPIGRVEKFRTQNAVGSGFLQAYVEEAWVDVARYSNTLATKFHLLADKLEDLRTTGEVIVHPEEERDKNHCLKCGMRLSASGESCPRCLPRKAIVARLGQLLRPQWPTALAMFGLMLFGVAMELAPPKLQQYLVDQILARGEATPNAQTLVASLSLIVVALAVTRVLLGLVNWIKGVLANKVGIGLTFELRSQLVRKLHALGVGYYVRHQVGSLVSQGRPTTARSCTACCSKSPADSCCNWSRLSPSASCSSRSTPSLRSMSSSRPRSSWAAASSSGVACLSQVLPLLGFQQQAGRHIIGHAAGHPGGQGLRARAARVRPFSPLERLSQALA